MSIWIVLSVLLITATITIGQVRRWLERRATVSVRQNVLIDEYYKNATRFLDATNHAENKEAREIITDIGYLMMDGTRLIQMLILSRKRLAARPSDNKTNQSNPLRNLSVENVHILGRAMGAALLTSTYNSLFFGAYYRAILTLLLKESDKEVKEPQQLIVRYQRATTKKSMHNERCIA